MKRVKLISLTTIAIAIAFTFIACKGNKSKNNTSLFLWDNKITVQVSNKEILSKYSSFAEFVDKDAPQKQQIVFTTNVALRNFEYIAIQYIYDEEQEQFNIFKTAVKHSIDELLPKRPFIVNWMEIGTFPHAGISFIDENNVKRHFAIVSNNAEPEEDNRGHILLIEFSPVKSS
jgi:hypothetical protein